MISITKKEAEYIRDAGYKRYVKLSSRTHKKGSKHYWLVENPKVLKALENWREKIKVTEE